MRNLRTSADEVRGRTTATLATTRWRSKRPAGRGPSMAWSASWRRRSRCARLPRRTQLVPLAEQASLCRSLTTSRDRRSHAALAASRRCWMQCGHDRRIALERLESALAGVEDDEAWAPAALASADPLRPSGRWGRARPEEDASLTSTRLAEESRWAGPLSQVRVSHRPAAGARTCWPSWSVLTNHDLAGRGQP